jgi:hypothetical protein
LPSLAAHLGAAAQRVCDECDDALDGLAREERAAWRVCRVAALLDDGGVAPYFDVPRDTTGHKARRLLRGTVEIARRCPLLAPATVTITVEVLEILVRYGPAGLATLVLRREFVEAAELLRRVAGVDAAWPKSAHELTAAIYYLLAFRRGERGADPERERRDHAGDAPCDAATLGELKAAAAAALWCYAESPTAVQLVAGQQGWTLLFERGFLAEPFAPERDVVAEPAFFCLASGPGRPRREVMLAVRGTASVHDVATDIRAVPAAFPPPPDGAGDWTAVGGTFAFAGMARAAQYIFEETAPALRALATAGYGIVLTGHSLGAGVASLLAVLVRDDLDDNGLAASGVRCFGFATPACVDEVLARRCERGGLVTAVVLHDDVVPRLTATSLRRLMSELLRQRETCMEHWRQDLDAVWGRLRHGLWAP